MDERRAFFLDMPDRGGQRFCIYHPAHGVQRGRVLYLHPFAEEMNKARRMAALQSRALAAQGFDVLQLDLLGCGDSSGDFGDASWEDWLQDGLQASRWLRKQAGAAAPLWLWGLRAGGLLAAELASRLDEPTRLLLWQPVLSGKQMLQQFLRLKLASAMVGGQSKSAQSDLLRALTEDGHIDIAGYRLSAALAAGLERVSLQSPPPGLPPTRLCWFEISSQADAEPSPAARTAIERWRAAGHDVRAASALGPGFWQTTEIEDAPSLIEASLAALRDQPAMAVSA